MSKDKSYLDTCLKEACESIQRCLALLSGHADPEDVEQKARREDVLNQLLLLLNTAINRKQKAESRLLVSCFNGVMVSWCHSLMVS